MLIVNFITVLGGLKQMNKNRQIAIERIAEMLDECNITDYGFKDILKLLRS